MRTMRWVFVVATVLSAWGCSSSQHGEHEQGEADTQEVLVYVNRGTRQCELGGQTPELSEKVLVDGGVDVLRSTCGYATGIAHAAVCGAPTNDILVHAIRRADLSKAEQLGYREIDSLVDPAQGIGYELVECAKRIPDAPDA